MTEGTSIESRANILGDIFIDFKSDERFTDFFQYNDLGLPLAYAVSAGIIPVSKKLESFIDETFDVFLSALGLEDTGWESLEDILVAASMEL